MNVTCDCSIPNALNKTAGASATAICFLTGLAGKLSLINNLDAGGAEPPEQNQHRNMRGAQHQVVT